MRNEQEKTLSGQGQTLSEREKTWARNVGRTYRQRAKNFADMANTETDPHLKIEYTKIAQDYLRLADLADKPRRMLNALTWTDGFMYAALLGAGALAVWLLRHIWLN